MEKTFQDNANNMVKDITPPGFKPEWCKVLELAGDPGHGYLVDTRGHDGKGAGLDMAPCMCWYGPGERNRDLNEACDEQFQG